MKAIALVVGLGPVLCLSVSVARAQGSPSTCSFNGPSATLTVNVDGNPAVLRVLSRAIQLNGTQCGPATVDNTNTIEVNGGALADTVTVTGNYSPGLTPEAVGSSEIEFNFSLASGKDTVKDVSAADLREFPVENVSWEDAQAFLKTLAAMTTRSVR